MRLASAATETTAWPCRSRQHALRADGPVEIEGAECVAKSYPGFFEDLAQIRQ